MEKRGSIVAVRYLYLARDYIFPDRIGKFGCGMVLFILWASSGFYLDPPSRWMQEIGYVSDFIVKAAQDFRSF